MATSEATHRAIDAVWRIEAAKVIAGVARMVRDVGLAEELAQDALVAALEHWPDDGVPDNPGAWLMRTAKNRALDRLRQEALHARKHEELGADMEALQAHVEPDFVDALAEASADDIGDDLLRLVFTACHPLLPTEGRVALTVRLLGGLSTDEIARAFLVPEATVAQRIVRAKRTLAAAKVPFEVPDASERAGRLASVLEVVYLIFNEGYSATAGDDWMRPALCEDALRLGRILAELVPDEPEVHGLVALMEIQASRSRARIGPSGEPVLIVSPCSSHDLRNWSPERYAAVADHAVARHGMRVLICGGRSDLELSYGARIAELMRHPATNLVGKDTLLELLATLVRATAVLTPDSGPAHMATTVGTPVIGLYAATNPARSGPYYSREWCVDRFDAAARRFLGRSADELPWPTKIERPGVMDLIEVGDVIGRLDALMAAGAPRTPPGGIQR